MIGSASLKPHSTTKNMGPLALLLPIVKEVIGKVIPDPQAAAEAKLRAAELVQKGEMAYLDADVKLALAQIDVNKVEAAQPGIFKGGWRPAAGWICVFGLVYPILRLLLPWALQVFGVQGVPELPPLDTSEYIMMLGGLLGVGTMRHRERIAGKA